MKCPYCQAELVAIPVLELQGCPDCNLLAPEIVIKELISLADERTRFCNGLHDVVESWGADCMVDEAKEALDGAPRPPEGTI